MNLQTRLNLRALQILVSNFPHPVRFTRSLGRHAIFLLCVLIGLAAQTVAQAPSAAKSIGQYDLMVEALIKKVSPNVVQILVTAYAPLEHPTREHARVAPGP